jgi:amylovoran biosynthesis glycosyltransferase AmsD
MVQKRKVAIFLNDMHQAGGIQRVAVNLARDLKPTYETLVLSAEPLNRPVFYDAELNFQSLNTPVHSMSRIGRFRELVNAGLKLRHFVKTHQVDTVLAIWYHLATVAAFALPKSVKTVGCEHISYFVADPRWQRIRHLSYPKLDAVVGLTQEDMPFLSRVSKSVHLIPNYVYQVDSPPPIHTREKILLTVGHLTWRKGIDRLLWALKEPLQTHPDWKLVIVGGGEQAQVDAELMNYVATLIDLFGLRGRVEFQSATEQVLDWYSRASIFVLGSREEGLPMVLLEAKSCGLPVVGFNCPTGPKEIIRHGVDGFLIENDTNAFANAANALMNDPDLLNRMSLAAIEDTRSRFSVDTMTAKWTHLIESLHESG